MEDLSASFEEFQSKMTKSLWEQQQQLRQSPPAEGDSTVSGSTDSLSCLEQAKYVEQRLDATSALLAEAVSSSSGYSGPADTPLSTRKSPRRATPHRDMLTPLSSLGQRGTPAARPLNWLVQQANSEVKCLRARAEKVRWTLPVEEEAGDRYIDKENMAANEYNSPPPPAREGTDPHKRTAAHVLQVRNLEAQLEESLRIICEMDKLVHAALVGNLSSGGPSSPRASLQYAEEEDEEEEFELGHVGQMTPGYKLRGSFDPSDWSVSAMLPSGV